MHFPKGNFPNDNFPKVNFPNVHFPKCTFSEMYIFPNDNFSSGNLGNGTDCSLTKNTKKGTERNVDGQNDWKTKEQDRNDLARSRTERNNLKKVRTCPSLPTPRVPDTKTRPSYALIHSVSVLPPPPLVLLSTSVLLGSYQGWVWSYFLKSFIPFFPTRNYCLSGTRPSR